MLSPGLPKTRLNWAGAVSFWVRALILPPWTVGLRIGMSAFRTYIRRFEGAGRLASGGEEDGRKRETYLTGRSGSRSD